MQYMGGKSRIARQIAEFINEIPRRKVQNCQAPGPDNHNYGGGGADCFVSLFCGSCAVESKVQGFSRKILNDRHKYGYSTNDVVSYKNCNYERKFTNVVLR